MSFDNLVSICLTLLLFLHWFRRQMAMKGVIYWEILNLNKLLQREQNFSVLTQSTNGQSNKPHKRKPPPQNNKNWFIDLNNNK